MTKKEEKKNEKRLSRCCKAPLEKNKYGFEMPYCSKCGDSCLADIYIIKNDY